MQARATQRSRHVQLRDVTLTPAIVHNLHTMTRLDEGDQTANRLLQLLNTIAVGISNDLMPRELDNKRHGQPRNPVVWY